MKSKLFIISIIATFGTILYASPAQETSARSTWSGFENSTISFDSQSISSETAYISMWHDRNIIMRFYENNLLQAEDREVSFSFSPDLLTIDGEFSYYDGSDMITLNGEYPIIGEARIADIKQNLRMRTGFNHDPYNMILSLPNDFIAVDFGELGVFYIWPTVYNGTPVTINTVQMKMSGVVPQIIVSRYMVLGFNAAM